MVGGYSESPLLQNAIKEAFTGLDVVIPIGASSTILRGALVYGHSPVSIRERVLKYTYGVETTEPFIEGTDSEYLKVKSATGVLCRVFDKHVEKGQIVKCNESQVKNTYYTIQTFQSKLAFDIFATEQCNPRYTTECSLIGELEIDLPEPEEQSGREIIVTMTFSGTEIIVKAVDEKTGQDSSVFINFIG
jgi:molecular chaperone DnaK (HSP70)